MMKLKEEVQEYERAKTIFIHSLALTVSFYAGLAVISLKV